MAQSRDRWPVAETLMRGFEKEYLDSASAADAAAYKALPHAEKIKVLQARLSAGLTRIPKKQVRQISEILSRAPEC
jgi:hypothetical protein